MSSVDVFSPKENDGDWLFPTDFGLYAPGPGTAVMSFESGCLLDNDVRRDDVDVY